jgi:hypothetical protein
MPCLFRRRDDLLMEPVREHGPAPAVAHRGPITRVCTPFRAERSAHGLQAHRSIEVLGRRDLERLHAA